MGLSYSDMNEVDLLREAVALLEAIHAEGPTTRDVQDIRADLTIIRDQLARQAPSGAIVPKTYDLMRRAVEEGVAYGWGRAWKYREGEPDNDVAQDCIEKMADGAMSEICERFHFPPVVE